MKLLKVFLSLLFISGLSCTEGTGPVVHTNTYVPSSVPELSVAESVAKQGIIHSADGKETLVIIYPVVGVKIIAGKIKVNQNVTVISNGNPIDTQTDIYGPGGLTFDLKKTGGNPNLTFAGVELATEIVPPPALTGSILISIVIKDLNSNGSVVKLNRGFKNNNAFNPNLKPCNQDVAKSLTVKDTQPVPSPSASLPPAEPCKNEIIKTYKLENALPYLSGVDKVSTQKEPDSFLIGKWSLSKPVFNWNSETDSPAFDPNSGNPAPTPVAPGKITIFQNKQFTWEKDTDTTQGIMEQVIPRSYADPKQTYWKIYFGSDNYYLYLKDGRLFINELDSHLYALTGTISS